MLELTKQGVLFKQVQGPWCRWEHGVWAEDPVKANAAKRKRMIPQEVVGLSTCLLPKAFRTLPESPLTLDGACHLSCD